jgi:chemotaxis protein methyltransferase CheR
MLIHSKAAIIESIYHAQLSPELFMRFTGFIQQRCGIRIDHAKQTMLEGRLRKRMRELMLPTFEDYANYLFRSERSNQEETIRFFDAVTTNKTEFFRESAHFDYLHSIVLPAFMTQRDRHPVSPFRIWSAGCSTGEEAYSLAMVLHEFAESHPGFKYAVLATDLSARALGKAKTAVYDIDQLEDLKPAYRRKYFVSAGTPDSRQMRIAPCLRDTIVFKRFNFMTPEFPVRQPLQAVFCRNVMIYFDRPTRERLVNRLAEKLAPGGCLFTGHSESLAGFPTTLKPMANAVYQKPQH